MSSSIKHIASLQQFFFCFELQLAPLPPWKKKNKFKNKAKQKLIFGQ